jgi:hypothetical protein
MALTSCPVVSAPLILAPPPPEGGDSHGSRCEVFCFVTDCPPGVLRRGLAPAPQTGTAGPAARRFFAAFSSRSWAVPQAHVRVRTLSGISGWRVPQWEHSLEEGNHRSTTITSRPYQAALYSSMLRSAVVLAGCSLAALGLVVFPTTAS